MTPMLPSERALRFLKQQLEELSKLKGCRYEEIRMQEEQWKHVTENIIEKAFGNPSTNLNKYYMARAANNLVDINSIDPRDYSQAHFDCRIEEFEALLRGLISTLELELPEEEPQGVYGPGDEFAFYRDLSLLVARATKDILIVDPYLSHKVFVYVEDAPATTAIRILSTKPDSHVVHVAEKYGKSRSGPLELRSSNSIHDRVVFLDSQVWVTGGSLKDAARKASTYLAKLPEPLVTAAKDVYEKIWQDARGCYTSSQ